MGRYELVRLAQLIFSLGLMFGAFLVGLGVGWWRWRRPEAKAERERADAPPRVNPGLFTATERPDAERSDVPLDDRLPSVAAFSPGPRELEPTADPNGWS